MGTLVGKFAVLFDAAARGGVVLVGVLLVREFWGDDWFRHRERLMLLVVMSVVTAALAFAAAIGLTVAGSSGQADDRPPDDRMDPIG